MRIATASVRTGFVMTWFYKGCGVRRDTRVPPYGGVTRSAVGRADVGIGPYESITRSAVVIGRSDVGIAPYGGETEIHLLSGGRGRTPPLRRATRGAEEESPSHGCAVPAPFRQGVAGRRGVRIATAGVRTGFAMTVFCKGSVQGWAAGWGQPALRSVARSAVGRADVVGSGPYERARGPYGRAVGDAGPYERSQEVQWLLGGAM